MLYEVFLTSTEKSVKESLECDHLKKATEQDLPVVLLIMLHKVISI